MRGNSIKEALKLYVNNIFCQFILYSLQRLLDEDKSISLNFNEDKVFFLREQGDVQSHFSILQIHRRSQL